ncbi:MAG: trigger factor [Candidatus Coatesbacteria bacterium]|nr:trigger factor [Candidatus Coatesbacteria bacterium]
MKLSANKVSENREELLIEIPKEDIAIKKEEKLKKYGKNAQLKGFRKGKAPKWAIENAYKDKIATEIIEEYYKIAIEKAREENPSRILSYASIKEFDFKDDTDLKMLINYPLIPEVQDIDFKELEYSDIPLEVKDEEINKTIDDIRDKLAYFKTVDKKSEIGDFLLVTFEGDDPNKEPATLEVMKKEKGVIDLEGLSKGEQVERELEISDADGSVSGSKKGKVKINVLAVQNKVLPEINDDLAKAATLGETLLEMRLKIREEIMKYKEEEARKKNEDELVNHLVKRYPLQIPEEILNDAAQDNINHFLKHYGDAFKADAELEKKLIEREKKVVERSYRWALLKDHIIEKEKINVTLEEAEKSLRDYYKEQYDTNQELIASKPKLIEKEVEYLKEQKVLNLLTSHGKKVEMKEELPHEHDPDGSCCSKNGEQSDEVLTQETIEENNKET